MTNEEIKIRCLEMAISKEPCNCDDVIDAARKYYAFIEESTGDIVQFTTPKCFEEPKRDNNGNILYKDSILPVDIGQWCLSRRLENCLRGAEIDSAEKLFDLSAEDLLSHLGNFGRKSLKELQNYIHPLTLPINAKVKLIEDKEAAWPHRWHYPRMEDESNAS